MLNKLTPNKPLFVSFWLLLANPLQADSAPDVEIRELSEGVWLHVSRYTFPGGNPYSSNGLVVQTGDELTLVDTAWGEAKTGQLLESIAAQIGLPVTKAVVTHYHGDRTAGVDLLEARGVEVYAHPLTQRLAMQHGLPVPDQKLDVLAEPGSATQLGGIRVMFPGPAHTMDNLVVWLNDAKILFGGCAVRAAAAATAGNTAHGELASWIEVMHALEETYGEAELVIPGHGTPGGPELLRHTSRLVLEASR